MSSDPHSTSSIVSFCPERHAPNSHSMAWESVTCDRNCLSQPCKYEYSSSLYCGGLHPDFSRPVHMEVLLWAGKHESSRILGKLPAMSFSKQRLSRQLFQHTSDASYSTGKFSVQSSAYPKSTDFLVHKIHSCSPSLKPQKDRARLGAQ